VRDISTELPADGAHRAAAPRAAADPIVAAIHTAVPGRARYMVAGLRGSDALKETLELGLSEIDGIDHASANPLTGNVLVMYDGDLTPQRVAALIGSIVRKRAKSRENGSRNGVGASSPARSMRRAAANQARRASVSGNGRGARWNQAGRGKGRRTPWHAMEADAVLARLETSPKTGLSQGAALDRIRQHGPNVLPEAEPRSSLGILAEQFSTWPVALLSAAAGISILTGGVADAVAIMGVVAINAVIGFVTESQSEKTLRSLKNLVHPTATVVRERRLREIAAGQVAVGDILVLKPGMNVAADSRLIEAHNLTADESALTGESMPVTKIAAPLNSADVPLPDRVNMVYMGTHVTGGQGLAVVVATGRATEIGRVQRLAAEADAPETPMQRELVHIGNQLVLVAGAACGAVFAAGLLRGYGFLEMLKSSISLAVAAVPEGLPAVATTTLALGVMFMRRHRVIIRRLDSVETLGCVQTVCLDKTGTLTLNRMAVVGAHAGMRSLRIDNGQFFDGEKMVRPLDRTETAKLIEICALCSESTVEKQEQQYVLNGSPTENALVYLAIGAGLDVRRLRQDHPVLRVTMRSEGRNFMSTLHRTPGGAESALGGPLLVAVKGSPAEVLAMCSWMLRDGKRTPLSDQDRSVIETENQRMAERGLRVLGCAYREIEAQARRGELHEHLTWAGLVGMADPVRGGAKDLMRAFHRAGLDTVMITGDQSATARALGTELGLSRNGPIEVLDSTHLANIDSAELTGLSEKVQVFARVSPANKLHIVRALQRAGKVVAMTGDGINDGPALKAADIGVAMGEAGTDVAREVADVVLEDDNLETMLVAIGQGRTIYRNIRKSLHFLLSTNLSEIVVMFAAIAAGLGQPLTAMQLLWINLISDIFPGLALALEPPEADVMSEAPRDSSERILDASAFVRFGSEATALSAGALGAYAYGLARYGAGPQAATIAFTSLASGQLLHAVSCRSATHSVFDETSLPPNPYLTAALVGSFGAQVLTFVVPQLRSLLGIVPITITDAAVMGASVILPFAFNEATKTKRKQEPQRQKDAGVDVAKRTTISSRAREISIRPRLSKA
jgi:P-type Ca2+ transporter type 2C